MRVRTWKFWTEGKLELLGDYMAAFNVASSGLGETNYLDLFAGTPDNQRETGAQLAGSARRAFTVRPPFSTVVLFEQAPAAAGDLRRMIASDYPGRDGRVYEGDCNEQLGAALGRLRADNYAWRPTLAFLDPYKTNIRWETFERLARFRERTKYKTELLILLHSPGVPRGAAVSPEFVDDVSAMFGSSEWTRLLAMRQRGDVDAARFRAELGNLLRWRLERVLGYRATHLFQVLRQGSSGTPLYDLVFATDNPTGDKIMRDLLTRSTQRFPQMAQRAAAARRDQAERESGTIGLFSHAEVAETTRVARSDALYVRDEPWQPDLVTSNRRDLLIADDAPRSPPPPPAGVRRLTGRARRKTTFATASCSCP